MSKRKLLVPLVLAAVVAVLVSFVLPGQIRAVLERGGQSGGVEWIVRGVSTDLPFGISGDSVILRDPGGATVVTNLRIRFDPWAFRSELLPFFSLQAERVVVIRKSDGEHSPPEEEHPTSAPLSSEPWVFPSEWMFPFRTSAVIEEVSVSVGEERVLASDVRLTTLGTRAIGVVIEESRTPRYASGIRWGVRVDWERKDLLRLSVRARSGDDSLSLHLRAPTDDLRMYSGELAVSLPDPRTSLPDLKETPFLPSNISLTGTLTGSENLFSPSHTGNLSFQTDPLKPLPSMEWKTEWTGRGEFLRLSLDGRGKGGESVRLNGSGNTRSAQVQGAVEKMSIEIEEWTLPIDFQIERAEWIDGGVSARLTTRDGTDVEVTLDSFSPLGGSLRMLPAPREEWANTWTEGNTSYQSGEITGRFNSDLIALEISLAGVEAYGFAVDSLKTELKIDSTGLVFWNGRLVRDRESYPVRGEIEPWKTDLIRFSLSFPDSGEAELFGHFSDRLSVRGTGIPMKHLPFGSGRETMALLGTGDLFWSRDMQQKTSAGIVRILTSLDNTAPPIRVRGRFSQAGDTLTIDTVKVVQSGNTLRGSAVMVPGKQSRIPGGILRAEVGTDGIELASLLAPWIANHPIRGKMSGEIRYDEEFGLEGKVEVNAFSLRGEETPFLLSHKLTLEADNDQLQLYGRLHTPIDPSWDSDFALGIENLFYPQKKIAAALATDGDAVAWVEATALDFSELEGKFHIEGKWALPGSEVVLESVGVDGSFDWNTAQGVSALNAALSKSEGILIFGQSEPLPLRIEGGLSRGKAEALARLLNGKKQSIRLDFAYDLGKMELNQLKMGSQWFDWALSPTQQLSVRGFDAALEENRISFVVPRIRYTDVMTPQSDLFAVLSSTEGVYSLAPKDMRSGLSIRTQIDSMIFSHSNLPELTAWSLLQMIPEFLSKKNTPTDEKKERGEGKPINLDLKIEEGEQSVIGVKTNVLQLPLSANLSIRGTDLNPILTGDIRAPDDGVLIVQKDRYTISEASVTWEAQPIDAGSVEVQALRTLRYCTAAEHRDSEESCDVALTASGTLERIGLNARSEGCAEELPFRYALQSLQLGCISSTSEQNLLGTGLQAAEELLEDASRDIAVIINRNIGSDLFGAPKFDLARGAQNYLEVKENDLDSASISGEIPFYLSNDSTLVFNIGYTKATGSEAAYNDLIRGGFRWQFHEGNSPDEQWPGVYSLEAGAQWRRFLSSTDGDRETENRLEWSIGAAHEVGFWGDCLFGRCRDQRSRERRTGEDDDLF